MTKFKLFAMIAILSTMIIDAVPCGTGGTPRRPTPSPKNDPKNGAPSRPNTPTPSK
jgi:hypothetical protein